MQRRPTPAVSGIEAVGCSFALTRRQGTAAAFVGNRLMWVFLRGSHAAAKGLDDEFQTVKAIVLGRRRTATLGSTPQKAAGSVFSDVQLLSPAKSRRGAFV